MIDFSLLSLLLLLFIWFVLFLLQWVPAFWEWRNVSEMHSRECVHGRDWDWARKIVNNPGNDEHEQEE